MAQTINRLDLMIAYSCNISCAGCISLSDRKRDGIAGFTEITQWVEHWSRLISPEVVTLFGGEPCLHPRLPEICFVVRQHWPNTTIRLITNGYLLDNFDSSVWFNYAPVEIQISIHRKDHESFINQNIKKILANRQDWQVSKNNNAGHEQLSWTSEGIKIYKSIFKDFVVPYQAVEQAIKPWYSNAKEAHAICGAPNTPVLYKGKLYKCPAVANAMDLTNENWFDYVPCDGLDNLDQFIAGIGKPEKVCGQCPDRSQAVVVDHFDKKNVIVKQKIPR